MLPFKCFSFFATSIIAGAQYLHISTIPSGFSLSLFDKGREKEKERRGDTYSTVLLLTKLIPCKWMEDGELEPGLLCMVTNVHTLIW